MMCVCRRGAHRNAMSRTMFAQSHVRMCRRISMFQFRSARGAKGVWGKAMSLSSLKRPTAGNGQQPTKRPRESTSAVFKSFLVSICKSPCPPPKKHPRVPQGHIRVGTACGGWSSEIFALEHLKVKHAHVFDCDKESAVHRLVQHLHKPHIWYDDVTHDDFRTAPACDVFVAGFPCQPFSAAGLGRGMPRSPRVSRVVCREVHHST